MLPKEYHTLEVKKEDSGHWWFLCPFHDDRSPSMSVTKTGEYAGFFKCWACGASGSPRTFAKKMGLQVDDFTRLEKYHKRKSKNRKLSEIELARLCIKYQQWPNRALFDKLAKQLGLNPYILEKFRVGFDGQGYTFPMYGPNDEMIGIRRRFPDSTKRALKGSTNGLIVPVFSFNPKSLLIVTEGESDCMAAFQMGFQAIGRPGNMQCCKMLADWMEAKGFNEVVLFADNNTAGKKGVDDLSKYLILQRGIVAKIINPPKIYKDLREWFKAGAKPGEISELIDLAEDQIGVSIARYRCKYIMKVKGGKHD